MHYLFNPLPHSGINNIIKAKDEFYYTSDGKKYIDLESGIWCASIGHNHNSINKIIHDQLNGLSHISKRVLPSNIDRIAEKLLHLAEMQGKVMFLNTGSEAIEFSMILAKLIHKNGKTISFEDNYVSAYGQATRIDEKINIQPCLKCEKKECSKDCKVLKDKIDKNAIFIFDPFCFSRLVLIPPQKLIKRIEEEIKLNNGILIVDEITTGIGRTGKWFGYDHFEIKPDMIVLGKSLGNGYPVSAVIINEFIIKKVERSKFGYYQSHQNDPMGCKIAEGVIEEIQENNLIDVSKELGASVLSKLKEELFDINCVEDIRGIGLLIGIQISRDITVDEIYNKLLEKRIIIGISVKYNVLNVFPPYTINPVLIPKIAESIKTVIFEIEQDKKRINKLSN